MNSVVLNAYGSIGYRKLLTIIRKLSQVSQLGVVHVLLRRSDSQMVYCGTPQKYCSFVI